MTLSYRSAPVQAYNARDQVKFLTFPWPTPAGDGGLGGGGSESITVKMGTDDYRLAWKDGSVPAGFGYLAQPTLTGAEDWWLHGIHGYGRVTWSPRYGVVVTGTVGLRTNGTVGHVNASYFVEDTPGVNQSFTWKYMAPYYSTGGEGGANAWDYHLGWDIALQSDLVVVREERRVYRISGSFGTTATRGAAVWTMTAAHQAAGYLLDCDFPASGFDRIHLPWRTEWWIVQVYDSAGPTPMIWGFNRSQSGDSSAFNVGIDSAAMTRITSLFPDNLCLSVDQMGQRVIAAQADVLAAPTTDNGQTKYPLLLWEINASTRAWTPITLNSPLYVTAPGKSRGHNPMCWHGGFRWIYWDKHGDTGSNTYYQTPSTSLGYSYSEGGFKPRLIYIPKSGAPRNITFTSNAAGTMAVVGDGWTDQKHQEYTYRPANDRVYLSGGDINGGGDGQQSIWSFDPENAPATLTQEESFNFVGRPVRPANVDEHGMQIRNDEFWMIYGYPYPTSINIAGNMRHGTWESAVNQNVSTWHDETGGTQVLWKWNPTTRVWTTHALTAAAGETGPFGNETIDPLQKITSAHQKRWYYDSAADRMAIAANGGNVLYQTTCAKFVEFSTGSPKYRVFVANRLFSGATTLPDGRSVTNPLWTEDSAAIDSTTGYLYVYNNATGDLYRIKTWTSVGNTAYPSYSHNGQPHLPVEWCCKLPATPGTANVTKMVCMHGSVWVVITYAAGRARVFSWAPTDSHAWEHDTPYGMCCGAIAVYKHAGVDKMVAIGGAAVSAQRNGPPYKRIWTGAVT